MPCYACCVVTSVRPFLKGDGVLKGGGKSEESVHTKDDHVACRSWTCTRYGKILFGKTNIQWERVVVCLLKIARSRTASLGCTTAHVLVLRSSKEPSTTSPCTSDTKQDSAVKSKASRGSRFESRILTAPGLSITG